MSVVFNGMLCEGPIADVQGPANEKNSRVGRLFVSPLKSARAADILNIMHFEKLRRQVLVLSPESRSVSEVGVSGVVPSSGVLPGITSLMCGTPVLDRGWKLLCKNFNSSQPRFGGNGI